MTRPLSLALAVLLALALVGAGCGGSSTVTETVTTDEIPTTQAPPTTEAPPTTAAPPTTEEEEAGALEERLPAEDDVPGLRDGSVRELPTATTVVDALYQQGDPTRPQAQRRLEDAGYQDGVLRDQTGEDPSSGLTLFRAYVLRFRDEEAARREVDDSVQEVEDSTTFPSEDVEVPGIPGARGLAIDVDQGGTRASVLFVTFGAGPYLYGYQAFSREGAQLPRDAIMGAAQQAYERFGAVP